MNFVRFYIYGSIIVGLLQAIRGVIVMLDPNRLGSLGSYVAILSFLWVPICISTLVVFLRQKISAISPASYLIYHIAGSVAATMLVPKPGGETGLPLGFTIAGTLFGIFYLFINYRMIKTDM